MIENRKSKKEKMKMLKEIQEHIENKQIADNEKIDQLVDKLLKENVKKKQMQTLIDGINVETQDLDTEITKLEENLQESQRNKDQFETNIANLKETQNKIVDMANDLRDQELRRRDDISKSYKLNFSQVEQKLKNQGEECKRLSLENKVLAEKLRAYDEPLNGRGLDIRTITLDNSDLPGFKTHTNKKQVLVEMYKRFDKTKEQTIRLAEFQKALEIDIIESHSEIELFEKAESIENQFEENKTKNASLTNELKEIEESIEKANKQKDTLMNMCKDLKNKITEKEKSKSK